MPDEKKTRETADKLAKAGVDACFYWYDNNWHYLKKWPHLKKLQSPAPLPLRLLKEIPDYENIKLPVSDSIMSRNISMLIKLSWTKEELDKRIDMITHALK